jgi:hypothetical protein
LDYVIRSQSQSQHWHWRCSDWLDMAYHWASGEKFGIHYDREKLIKKLISLFRYWSKRWMQNIKWNGAMTREWHEWVPYSGIFPQSPTDELVSVFVFVFLHPFSIGEFAFSYLTQFSNFPANIFQFSGIRQFDAFIIRRMCIMHSLILNGYEWVFGCLPQAICHHPIWPNPFVNNFPSKYSNIGTNGVYVPNFPQNFFWMPLKQF